ncbi:MAG TPA: DUF192 domain-containing protein [Candidatus Moranbacteria bacterium]|nr:DUF192 domain-containing protein [Candidatus Moranbacteria bacterium]
MKSKNIAKIISIVFFGASLILAGLWYYNLKNYKTVEIGGQKFFVKLVQTPKEKALGLSWRSDIKENEGMLFSFEKSGEYSFWMKGMKFDLDILWIEEGKIAYIAKNIAYNSLETIDPKIKADKVLEIKAGMADKFGFKIGDSVKIFY